MSDGEKKKRRGKNRERIKSRQRKKGIRSWDRGLRRGKNNKIEVKQKRGEKKGGKTGEKKKKK